MMQGKHTGMIFTDKTFSKKWREYATFMPSDFEEAAMGDFTESTQSREVKLISEITWCGIFKAA